MKPKLIEGEKQGEGQTFLKKESCALFLRIDFIDLK